MAFKFAAEVGDADTTGASASFLVQARITLRARCAVRSARRRNVASRWCATAAVAC
jgi:hypothetical protein